MQREADSTAVINAGKAAPVGGLSFIFKQADHVAYWPIASFRCAAEFGRYRGIADSSKPTDRQIYGFTA